MLRVAEGNVLEEPLQPGRYLLSTRGTRTMAAMEFEIRSDRPTELEFVVPKGVQRRILVPGSEQQTPMRQIWRDGSGRIVSDQRTWLRPADVVLLRGFVPGSYTVEVIDATGAKASGTFVVDESDDSDEVFELPLPGRPGK